MSKFLSKSEIRALYGVKPGQKGEIVIFGRAVPTGIKRSSGRRYRVEYDAFGRKVLKELAPSKPAVQIIEPDVQEMF